MISTGALIDLLVYGVPVVIGIGVLVCRHGYGGMPKPPKKDIPPDPVDDEGSK